MQSIHGKNNRNRLKTTGMGLGLVRLQMDVGLTEEARTTLASLQVFVQRQAGRMPRLSHLDRSLVPEEKGCGRR